jgi:hypothetical protein
MHHVYWQEIQGGHAAFHKGRPVAWVTEHVCGWYARTLWTDLGVYLTFEMAQGAATNMLTVERRDHAY